MSWVNGEKGPQCFCGMPTSVCVSEEGKLNYLLCIFHTSASGAMFYLPTGGRPEHWPNVTHDEIKELVSSGNKEHNISFEKNYCPCSGKCCENSSTFTPEHECEGRACEDCFVSECSNCGKSCSCDL